MKFLIYIAIGLTIDYIISTLMVVYVLAKAKVKPPKWWYVIFIPLLATMNSMTEYVRDVTHSSAHVAVAFTISMIAWPITLPIGTVSKILHMQELFIEES